MTEPVVSNYYLKLNGSAPAADLTRAIEEVTVESSLHLPDMLTMVIYDPDLKWVDNSVFALGSSVTVAFTSESSEIFDGEVVEAELEVEDGTYRLVVRALNRLHRLARITKSRVFANVTDGDMLSAIAGEHGLSPEGPSGGAVMEHVLQAAESNLVFLQRRAAAIGCLLYVKARKLCMKPLPASQTAAATFSPARNLVRFRARTSAQGQVGTVTARGWNVAQKQVIVGQATSSPASPRVGASLTADKWFGASSLETVDVTLVDQAAAEKLAGAQLLRRASRFVEAEAVAYGEPKVVAGAAVTIEDVGTTFGGTYLVTTATHRYTVQDGYTVEFSVSGANPDTLLATLLPEPPAVNARGLAPAIVTNAADPKKLGRVKVKFPWLGDNIESDWCRVVSIGAGPTRGVEWLPEVNDEVLVGFADGNLTVPFVVGGLWNGKDAPPVGSDAAVKSGKVVTRKLITRAGHEITFDDDDNAGGILIKDKDGNTLQIKTKEKLITVTSLGDMKFKADKAITIEAGGAIDIKATGNASLKSTQGVTVEASAQLQLKGNISKLEAAGTTEIKGGIVKIN
jgi:phage protein D